MACKHFLGGTYSVCTVVQGLMNPSLWEMRTYCRSDQPSACPLYQQHAATQENVPVELAMVLIGTAREPASAMAPRTPSLDVDIPTPSPIGSWRRHS